MIERIIEKLHESDTPPRMKAEIAINMACVHETEGRLFDAVIGYETAVYFFPQAAGRRRYGDCVGNACP